MPDPPKRDHCAVQPSDPRHTSFSVSVKVEKAKYLKHIWNLGSYKTNGKKENVKTFSTFMRDTFIHLQNNESGLSLALKHKSMLSTAGVDWKSLVLTKARNTVFHCDCESKAYSFGSKAFVQRKRRNINYIKVVLRDVICVGPVAPSSVTAQVGMLRN